MSETPNELLSRLAAAWKKAESGAPEDVSEWYLVIDDAAPVLFGMLEAILKTQADIATNHATELRQLRAMHERELAGLREQLAAEEKTVERMAGVISKQGQQEIKAREVLNGLTLKISELKVVLAHVLACRLPTGSTVRATIPLSWSARADVAIGNFGPTVSPRNRQFAVSIAETICRYRSAAKDL